MAQAMLYRIGTLFIMSLILATLFAGLYNLITGKGYPLAKTLALRVGLSLFLFLGIVLMFIQGWFEPHLL